MLLSKFSKVPISSFLGKFLRFPLRIVSKCVILPILQGRMRGKKWKVGFCNHGCWLGTYEYKKRVRFEKEIYPGSIVYDIGAHVGYYSLLASILVGAKGRVFAFEPLPDNLTKLYWHMDLNNCANVVIHQIAVSSKSGSVVFRKKGIHNSESSFIGGVEGDSIEVATASLDNLILANKILPADFIKIDVEGAEFEVLKGAKNLISSHSPMIFLATHGKDVHEECCKFLRSFNYCLESLNEKPVEETDEMLAYK